MNSADLMKSTEEIVSRLVDIYEKPPRIRDDDDLDLPRMIASGAGGGFIVSRKVDEIIRHTADIIKQEFPDAHGRLTAPEWSELVRAAYGPAFSAINTGSSLSENAQNVIDMVRKEVRSSIDAIGGKVYYFGCTFFARHGPEDFSFGPVRIQDRFSWLAHVRDIGAISNTTYDRIARS